MAVRKTYIETGNNSTRSQTRDAPYVFFKVYNSPNGDIDYSTAPFFIESIDSLSFSTNDGTIIPSDVTATLYAAMSGQSGEQDKVTADDIIGTVTFNGTATVSNVNIINNGRALDGHLYILCVFSKKISNSTWPIIGWDSNIQVTCTKNVYRIEKEISLSSPSTTISGTLVFDNSFPNVIKSPLYIYERISLGSGSSGSSNSTYSINGYPLFYVAKNDILFATRATVTPTDNFKKIRGINSLNYNIQITGTTYYTSNPKFTFIMIYDKFTTVDYYDDTSWVPCTVNYYDGTDFVECEPYYYDGTDWVPISTS